MDVHEVFFLRKRRPPRPTLFPYPTLSRSFLAEMNEQGPVAAIVQDHVRPLPAELEDAVGELPILVQRFALVGEDRRSAGDRKSTRLNSSHANISYAVFCLKKQN